jgi:hypothetical protein
LTWSGALGEISAFAFVAVTTIRDEIELHQNKSGEKWRITVAASVFEPKLKGR